MLAARVLGLGDPEQGQRGVDLVHGLGEDGVDRVARDRPVEQLDVQRRARRPRVALDLGPVGEPQAQALPVRGPTC